MVFSSQESLTKTSLPSLWRCTISGRPSMSEPNGLSWEQFSSTNDSLERQFYLNLPRPDHILEKNTAVDIKSLQYIGLLQIISKLIGWAKTDYCCRRLIFRLLVYVEIRKCTYSVFINIFSEKNCYRPASFLYSITKKTKQLVILYTPVRQVMYSVLLWTNWI